MSDDQAGDGTAPDYAIKIADGSYDWYKVHAIRARRMFKTSESAVLVLAACIPVSAAIDSDNGVVPAVLGGAVVVITGLRSVFHWQENYIRFSAAREAVEAERRLYWTGSRPYHEPENRNRRLAAKVTRIEQEELGVWMKIASEKTTE